MSVLPERPFDNLIGMQLNEAKSNVQGYPNVQFVPSNGMITADYNPERYRVFYNPETLTVESIENG